MRSCSSPVFVEEPAKPISPLYAAALVLVGERQTGGRGWWVQLDKTIARRLWSHPQAKIICSLPGMGPLLAAELLVAVGDLSSFPDAGHLAAYAGLAPVPRDSGRRTNNLHPPKRYHRSPRRVLYLSALSSLSVPGPSRDYYRRKRAQGRKHQQALMALARRRVDVLWALLRDNRCFELAAPIKTTMA
jgi:transposase